MLGHKVTFRITDEGRLYEQKCPGNLRDPLVVTQPSDDAAELKPGLPLLITLWPLAALVSAVGWLGYWRLRPAK